MRPSAIYSTEPAKGWLPWGAFAPFLGVLLVAVPTVSVDFALEHFRLENAKGDPLGLTGLFAFLIFPFVALGLVVFAWVLLVERRPLATIGLAGPKRAKNLLIGLSIGMATVSAVVGAIWTAGGLEAREFGPALSSPSALLNIGLLLVCFAVQSSVEEIVFRGWLLSAVAGKFNVPIAIVLNAIVFAFLHYSPHQPVLVIVSSLLFAVFACCWALKARNIWGVMGWHAGWNWLLATGFELPVTGIDAKQPALLVRMLVRGPNDLTGGAQGPEGSYLCSVFFVCASAFLLYRMKRNREALRQEKTPGQDAHDEADSERADRRRSFPEPLLEPAGPLRGHPEDVPEPPGQLRGRTDPVSGRADRGVERWEVVPERYAPLHGRKAEKFERNDPDRDS